MLEPSIIHTCLCQAFFETTWRDVCHTNLHSRGSSSQGSKDDDFELHFDYWIYYERKLRLITVSSSESGWSFINEGVCESRVSGGLIRERMLLADVEWQEGTLEGGPRLMYGRDLIFMRLPQLAATHRSKTGCIMQVPRSPRTQGKTKEKQSYQAIFSQPAICMQGFFWEICLRGLHLERTHHAWGSTFLFRIFFFLLPPAAVIFPEMVWKASTQDKWSRSSAHPISKKSFRSQNSP